MRDEKGRRRLTEELVRDADAHDRGDVSEIGAGIKAFERLSISSHRDGWNDPGLGSAYTFWDSWIDARNHHWQYYPSMPSG
jgi:hypothetical protein